MTASARWDRPAAEVEADVRRLTLVAAEARTHSPSDLLAWRLDEWLVTHPDAPVSTAADYPNWTPGGAA
ncbi:hypothetical protein ACIRF8_15055 [Streptomyces sp. NPDC102406]|uniref:hypothetical protein n=1 Tax=Streptomyces sp. NPDC102406 TaxID=3366171 RepID=UPI00382B4B75